MGGSSRLNGLPGVRDEGSHAGLPPEMTSDGRGVDGTGGIDGAKMGRDVGRSAEPLACPRKSSPASLLCGSPLKKQVRIS